MRLQMYYIDCDLFLHLYLFDNVYIYMVVRFSYLTLCLFI